MTFTDIANMRLSSQHLAGNRFTTPGEIAGWMGAIQAQDYLMSRWAVGIRLPGSTENEIEAAASDGQIIRTHLLRPTWHFVSPGDIYWLLQLSAPHLRSVVKRRHTELGLKDHILDKSSDILLDLLSSNNNLTREEIMTEFKKEGIEVDGSKSYHLLAWAEINGLICSGSSKGKKQTYALLKERVPEKESVTREDALTRLAGKYFTSHGPATLKDFAWWSGLSASVARTAIELAEPDLTSAEVDSVKYWMGKKYKEAEENTVYLLPPFDEFIISYKDRSAVLSQINNRKAVSDNGIFKPVIVAHGQVTGLWKRTIIKEKVVVETALFGKPGKSEKAAIEKAAEAYGAFIGKKPEVIFII